MIGNPGQEWVWSECNVTEKTIGFGRTPVREDKESLTVLHATIDQEISMLSSFDQLLHREITSVERAKKNALVLADKVVAVEKLLERRNLFYTHLSNEDAKVDSQIDVDLCMQNLQAVSKLDSGIVYALSDIDTDLQKLFINDIHQVYVAEESGREVLNKIDMQMRELYAKIRRINETIKGSRSFLESISKKISVLSAERARNVKSKNITGFAR